MHRYQHGFTLVEIAIVLVIIGLLLGGVFKGQELINSAKVKNLAGDFRSIPLFIYAYQDKFKRLPGDDPLVTSHLGATATLATTPVGSKAGNGIIEGDWNSTDLTNENVLFWQHIRLAGLATGSTDFSTTGTAGLPANAEGGQVGMQMTAPILEMSGTYYLCSSGLNGKLAQQLDVNLDDGTPNRGSLRAQETATDKTKPGDTAYEGNKSYVVCQAF
ncbi:MAG: prepilin-type N-terminal cleavage/methylation protein [Proteobacteria bacterium]|nr:prepilin-type N-terminal cleavage/methylation protein [Pseudomonadota bacterium]